MTPHTGFGVPNPLSTLKHHLNILILKRLPKRSKNLKTPVKVPSYRCFRSLRLQVRDAGRGPERVPGHRRVLRRDQPRGRVGPAAGAAPHREAGHGERSRLQLLLKLAGNVAAVLAFWLFNLAAPLYLGVFRY